MVSSIFRKKVVVGSRKIKAEYEEEFKTFVKKFKPILKKYMKFVDEPDDDGYVNFKPGKEKSFLNEVEKAALATGMSADYVTELIDGVVFTLDDAGADEGLTKMYNMPDRIIN